MDFKVYKKEAVKQPSGTDYIVSPNIIDIYPILESDEAVLAGCETLGTSGELKEQACALATIYQRGLDPLDLESGVRWSEALLEEINVVQLMADITEAVAEVTPSVAVVFDTAVGADGSTYLKYTLKAVA